MILKRFIAFEGIDGSGTTTQVQRLVNFCKNSSIDAVATMEPTNSPIGELIASFLQHKINFAPQTVVRLFATDRSEHIYGTNGIIEMLKKGNIVISDRYLFSSLAYQGFEDTTELTVKENMEFPLPQVLFFFDLPVEIAMSRIEKRAEHKERYEKAEFLENVRKNYLSILEAYKEATPNMNIVTIDASLSEDEIFNILKFRLQEIGILNGE